MDKAHELRQQVQANIVEIITKKLKSGQMSQERAKAIAQMVLEKLPEDISYQKLIAVIPTLDDHFEELSTAVVPVMVEYEDKMKKIVDQKVTVLLQDGRFDEALEITKKAIEHQKQLA